MATATVPAKPTNDKTYYTPFILRTGILYSAEITTIFTGAWAVCSTLSFVWTQQGHNAIIDMWNYAFVLLVICFVKLSRMTMDIFSKLLGKTTIDSCKLMISPYVKLSDDDSYKTHVADLFTEENDYNKFSEYVKSLAFSPWGRFLWVFMIVVVILAAPTYWHWYTQAGIYDALGPLWVLKFYVATNLLFGAFFFPAYISLVWLVVSVIRSTYSLHKRGPELKITSLPKLLLHDDSIREDAVMGYSAFYSTLKPIGSYISRATILLMLVVVLSSIGSVTGSFLIDTDIGISLNVIAVGMAGTAIGLFAIGQYVIHKLLSGRKEHILSTCCQERDRFAISSLFRMKDIHKLKSEMEIQKANKSGIPDDAQRELKAKEDEEYRENKRISLTKDIIESVEAGSTWGFSGLELLEFFATLSLEFVLLFI